MGFAKKAGIGAMAASLGLFGCANMSQNEWLNNENIGTAVGAVAGGLLGSQIGKGSGRTAAIVAGVAAGGLLGRMVGARLDERDRQTLAQQTQQVLDHGQDGQPIVWESDHSGASASITPSATQLENRPVEIAHTPKVQPVRNMTLLNEQYVTVKSANVRNAPDLSAEKIGGLPAGTLFTAVGRTDNDWILVGRRGVSIGYVYAPLVQSAAAWTPPGSPIDLDRIEVAGAANQGVELDAVDLDAMPVPRQVSAQVKCRTLNYDISADGSREQQSMRACQAPDGAWEIT